jgi:hypothetical protein
MGKGFVESEQSKISRIKISVVVIRLDPASFAGRVAY